MMALAPIHAAIAILKYHGVPVCIVGELALNYYNVPRVRHDLELCVPKSSSLVAPGLLCSTGLFEPFERDDDYNNYTEYKRGFPHVRTTSWSHPQQTIVFFPAARFGLDPVEKILIRPFTTPVSGQQIGISKEVSDMSPHDLANLPLPCLTPLLIGLARRYLSTRDDIAMIAVEQLIDGMNLDEAWSEKHLAGVEDAVRALINTQIGSKGSRIDYFSDNKITCFINDESEAHSLRLIPGFD
ncbi:ser/Thr protein phosphatase [Xylariaceae sp. FL0804]|nr:ser/Thr protein phosphatase [Xylariaceae sp. FL0804]